MSTDPERHSESSEVESDEDDKLTTMKKKEPYCLNRNDLLNLLQNVDPMEMLPAPVKRRVKALKQLQLETINIESQFQAELLELEAKYYKMCIPYYEKRNTIVSGTYEPNDEECVFESDDDEDDLTNDLQDKVKIQVEEAKKKEQEEEEKNIVGIPDFWLTIFKNVQILAENIQEHDEPILKHLKDIKVVFRDEDPMAFTLEFHFTPNEYFTNSVLTKEYLMKCTPEKNDPFSFEGPEIYKAKGCKIDWKKGKNITVKTVKKSQKHKSKGSTRTVTKTVQNDSFFNFFRPPIVLDDAEVDDEVQALLTSDYELGHFIRERIVPRAVLYFTGEALEDEEDEDYEEEEEDDDEDMEDEEDDDKEPGHGEGKPTITPIDSKCEQQ